MTREIRHIPERNPSRRHDRRLRIGNRANAATLRGLIDEDPDIDYDEPGIVHERPVTRGDCLRGGCNEQRPCPWVGCRHHLGLDVTEEGTLILHPHRLPWQHKDSCALDVAERGGMTLEQVGRQLDLTRERVRQIEVEAMAKVREAMRGGEDDDWCIVESKSIMPERCDRWRESSTEPPSEWELFPGCGKGGIG